MAGVSAPGFWTDLYARGGHAVVGFDFSPVAIAEARALARSDGVAAEFAERDIFTLGLDYERTFDGVWEYTCFCASDPRRRAGMSGGRRRVC
jgi:methyl halide transferase